MTVEELLRALDDALTAVREAANAARDVAETAELRALDDASSAVYYIVRDAAIHTEAAYKDACAAAEAVHKAVHIATRDAEDAERRGENNDS